jgi:hypothetical protein
VPKQAKPCDQSKPNEHNAGPYTCMNHANKKRFTFKEGDAFCLQCIISKAVGKPQKGEGAQKFGGAQHEMRNYFFYFVHGGSLFFCQQDFT